MDPMGNELLFCFVSFSRAEQNDIYQLTTCKRRKEWKLAGAMLVL